MYADLPPVTDVPGAAGILGCHPDTIRALIDRGELASVRLGRLVRIPRHSIVALLEATPKEVEGPARHAEPSVEPATQQKGASHG